LFRRDTQRSRVYAAEQAAFRDAQLLPIRGHLALQDLVDEITGERWWLSTFPQAPRHVTARFRRGGGATAWVFNNTITIGRQALMSWVILHELAHLAYGARTVGRASHGPSFCRAYLALVEHYLGEEAVAKLRRCMTDSNVSLAGEPAYRLAE